MKLTVNTGAAVQLPLSGPGVIQNLGPGIIYVDHDSAATTTTGYKLAVNASLVVTRSSLLGVGKLYVTSDTNSTDVRYVET